MNSHSHRSILTALTALAVFLGGLAPTPAAADPYNQPSVPLVVAIESIPNVWFHLDNSGSMDEEVLVDSTYFTSCSYNSVLQCEDPQFPGEGGMVVWSGRWDNGTSNDPEMVNITNIWWDAASVKSSYCGSAAYDGSGVTDYQQISTCLDQNKSRFGTSNPYEGRRRQSGQTRDFDIDIDWRVRSSALNVLFFDPKATYKPWASFDGRFEDADFSSALYWPVKDDGQGGRESGINLGNEADDFFESEGEAFYYNYWIDDKGFEDGRPFAGGFGGEPNMTDRPNGIVDEWDSYIRVSVADGGVSCQKVSHDPQPYVWPNSIEGINPSVEEATAAECQAATANKSAGQLQQDIANWFQYYRKRAHVQRGAVANVIVQLPEFRYGYGQINRYSSEEHLIPAATITDYPANGQNLLNELFGSDRRNLGTPLRTGLEWVGDMYSDGIAGDSVDIPSPITEYCQKNFTLLFTDGFWNGSNPGSRFSDVDGDGKSIRGSTQTLADVAAYYYQTDLSDNYEDGVPVDLFDTANWQHMVTYTVSFGVTGGLTEYEGSGWPFAKPQDDGSEGSWWYPENSSQPDRVDDLWHAAWNARGGYFNAQRPEDLYNSVEEALNNIAKRVSGAAAGSANTGSIAEGSRVFQARFDSSDWSGQLLAFVVNPDGTLGSAAEWEANEILTEQLARDTDASERKVWTWDPEASDGGGRTFIWEDLSARQQELLNIDPTTGEADELGPKRVAYLRGAKRTGGDDLELPNGPFRARTNMLGDIAHSDPIFVGFPPFFYSFGNYQQFFEDNKNRASVIYAGANDGMFHAFKDAPKNAGGGTELWAYVPNAIIDRLPLLTDPEYQHEFFVDGPAAYGDVQFGDDWKSVVVFGLRSGAQAVVGLDVTDPTPDSSPALWEFSDQDDPDLGFVYGQPQIKRMFIGGAARWVAIFSGGVNNTEQDGEGLFSESGHAHLFILSIDKGSGAWSLGGNYWKIPVAGGSASNPNGLFTPAAADVDGDNLVDYIYAGDRFGRMWRFDNLGTSGQGTGGWNVSFSGNPFFTSGSGQPITDRPAITAHPLGRSLGTLVTFGTGQYIESSDNRSSNYPTQSIYALWDFDPDYADRKELSASARYGYGRDELADATLLESGNLRTISNQEGSVNWLDEDGNPFQKGWYVDLPAAGERVVRRPVVRDDLVFFASLVPDDDPCAAGGTGWLMVFDLGTGLAPPFPVWDLNDDQDVTVPGDTLPGGDEDNPIVPVGVSTPSIPNLPVFIYDERPDRTTFDPPAPFPPEVNAPRGCDAGSARNYTFTTTSSGAILARTTSADLLSCGRQAWKSER